MTIVIHDNNIGLIGHRMRISTFKQTVSAALLSLSLAAGSPMFADQLLQSPDRQTRKMLFDYLNGSPPNFQALAMQSQTVINANEFKRAVAIQAEINRLQEMWTELSEVEAIQFNAQVSFGEYNAANGGFPISLFAPGTFIQGAVPITFSNALEMSVFPLVADDGPEMLSLLGAGRNAIATVTLKNLKTSPTQPGAIQGRISEVVFATRNGTQLGSYSSKPDNSNVPDGDTPNAQMIAAHLAQTLGIPAIGSTWDNILPFLTVQGFVSGTGQNFSGQLFQFDAGKFRRQKPLDRYDALTLAFGPTEQSAVLARKEVSRRSFGFNQPQRPFGILDCSTPDRADACGIIRLKRIDGQLTVVDVMSLVEVPQTSFKNAIEELPFDAETISGMNTANTQIAYTEAEFGGTRNFGAGALVFWAGQFSQKANALHDLRSGYSDTFSANTMLWIIDGGQRGTLVALQISEPGSR